jgi:hypothetical protein
MDTFKKLASAREILALDEEACLPQAYEAMLRKSTDSCEESAWARASLGFMFSAIIDFVRSRIDKKNAGLLIVFDRLRRKRNTVLV